MLAVVVAAAAAAASVDKRSGNWNIEITNNQSRIERVPYASKFICIIWGLEIRKVLALLFFSCQTITSPPQNRKLLLLFHYDVLRGNLSLHLLSLNNKKQY
jgi:hypothetical protein